VRGVNPVALLRALRPLQWSKNLFVLAALVFASGDQSLASPIGRPEVERTLFAFLAFCLASSAVYLLNDVLDAERDRAHPEKRLRPVAAGEVPVPLALVTSVVLALAALAIGVWIGGDPLPLAGVLGAYVVVNLLYSWRLKRVVLLDAFCIASGFLLRVLAGGVASGAEISRWLFLCTLFLALFLALNKRRAELTLLGDEGGAHRASLRDYSPAFLDQMVAVLAATTIVCYTMYTVDEDTARKFGEGHRLVWTVPFVLFGVGRYMLLVHLGRGGGNPTRILLGGDPLFLANTLAWAAMVVAVVKFGF
jgi:4-hydroxybenzoate polyprenyltransferase